MAKRSSRETPSLLVKRTGSGFDLVNQWDHEACSDIPLGAECEISKPKMQRSLDHLRLYWVVLHFCVDNSEGKYGRAEDLHDMIKMLLGYSRKVRTLVPNPQAIVATEIRELLDGLQAIISWCADRAQNLPGPLRSALTRIVPRWANVSKRLPELEQSYETIVLPGSIALDKMDQAEFNTFFERAMGLLEGAGYSVWDYIEEGKKKLGQNKVGQQMKTEAPAQLRTA
jgi:hypothetical protein